MKIFNFMKRLDLMSVLLCGLAMMFGADAAMAMAVTDNTAKNDPAGATVDEAGLNTDLSGTAASATQVREGDLADPEIDEYISKFRPYKFALDTDLRKKAKQHKVKGYEVEHYASGSTPLNGTVYAQVTEAASVTLTVGTHISKDDLKMLAPYSTICLPDVMGYDEAGTAEEGALMLEVLERTANTVILGPVNGPIEGGEMKVPAIPAGTEFMVCANACSESQMQVAPENYQPRPKTVFLQKKIVNMVMTDHFKEIVKKVPFYEQDLKDDALYNFRRKSSRTLWVGKQRKVKRMVSDTMGEEFVYTSEGILRQITNLFAINDVLTFSDLVAICKMQFTDYSVSNEAEVYCGKDFMEKLLNIDFTKHKDVSFTAHQDIGIDIRSFNSTWGRLNFKHEQALDDLGYSGAAAVIDMKSATRYIKEEDKTQMVDMKKGAGETREATREIHTQIDCLALHGHNSILVAPSNLLFKYKDASKATILVTSDKLDSTTLGSKLVDGVVVYLTAAAEGFPKGALVQYSALTQSWTEYAGEIYA